MQILFFISMVAVAALVWAAVSIARHVRFARHGRILAKRDALAASRSAVVAASEKPTVSSQIFRRGTLHWEQTETQTPQPPLVPHQGNASRDWAQLRNSVLRGANSLSSTALSDHGSRSPRHS